MKNILAFIFSALVVISGCVKQDTNKNTGGVAVYLAPSVSPAQLKAVDINALSLDSVPIISPSDIIAYKLSDNTAILTARAAKNIDSLHVPVSGLSFVVAVAGARVYSGAFWTMYSSQSFDGTVIEVPRLNARNQIKIKLGFPEEKFFSGTDMRQDPRIMEALKKAGKVK
jgi:hypothetical protein